MLFPRSYRLQYRGLTFFSILIAVAIISVNVLIINTMYSSVVVRETEKEFVHRLVSLKRGLNSYRKDFKKNPPNLNALIKNKRSFPYVRKTDLIDPATEKQWKYSSKGTVQSTSSKKSFSSIIYKRFAYLKYDKKKKLWLYYKTDAPKTDTDVK